MMLLLSPGLLYILYIKYILAYTYMTVPVSPFYSSHALAFFSNSSGKKLYVGY